MGKKVKDRLKSSQNITAETKKPKRKKQKLRELMAFTPKQMKKKYEGYGFEWHIRDFFIAYSIAIAVAVIFSYIFSFQLPYIIATFAISMFFAPIILTSQKKYRYESNRFADINIYMQQFAQGMIQTPRIVSALEDTMLAFSDGEMKDTIEEAIELLQESENVREGEEAAFEHISKAYGNKQLTTLHEFAIKIEDRGGDFTYEIDLLDRLRIQWKERIDEYQKDLSATTLFCVFEYAMILAICGFIQGNMPETMNITHGVLTQVAEVVAILIMYLFLMSLQKKKCQNWIEFDESMSEESANELLDYVENFNPAQKRNLSLKLGMLWIIASIILILYMKSLPVVIFCVIFEILLLNSHYIIYELMKIQIREEFKRAFPRWLFDICLLMQKENLTVSITKSIPEAPPIMKRELERLIDTLMENPADKEPLLQFLNFYNIPGVRETMSRLVSINYGGSTNNRAHMEKLVDENMKMIDKEDSIASKLKSAALTRYYYYPMLPCVGLMGCYFFMIIIKILAQIAEVLGL